MDAACELRHDTSCPLLSIQPPAFSVPMASETSEATRDSIAADYFDLLPFEPYPVQEDALLAWFGVSQGVLVCAPTGTGKTLIAEAAVYEALRTGRRMYYTTPLIALTDQKLHELQASAVRWGYPAESIGLVTGNRRVNPDAPVLVVVAEILLNRLLASDRFDFSNVSSVVMDEFHNFNDAERGIVWELSLGLLPSHVRTLLLSATVGNAMEFVQWLTRAHDRRLTLVQSTQRMVPLQFHWVDDALIGDVAEDMCEGDEIARRIPALFFCFNRQQCWTVAELLKGKRVIDKQRQAELTAILAETDLSQGAGPKLKALLTRGVGVHHAGVIPRYRHLVERLFQRKLLSICVCTETLSAGINLPARSVVLPTLLKGPRGKKKLVDTSTAAQIFGRAGRPQFDTEGHVYALAHEDDVKLNHWRERYDQIPEDTKDPGLLKAKKQLKKKMPKRRTGEQYWTEAQFDQLRAAPATNLSSRGPLPWRLLAYMLTKSPEVQPLRDLVGRRLLPPAKIEAEQKTLNRMLITLWTAGYVQLEPKPQVATSGSAQEGNAQPAKKPEPKEAPAAPAGASGLFSHLLEPSAGDGTEAKTAEADSDESRGFDLVNYRPQRAVPTESMDQLLHVRSINPLYAIYLSGQLAVADRNERLQALESVLEVPGSMARSVRVPPPSELPPGPLATERLDPRLLSLGLATAEELRGAEDDDEPENRGRGRFFDEQKPPPLPLGYKLLRLFEHDFPRVHDVTVRPVWIAGEVLEYGDFNKYVTTRKLQQQEGILFRHLLRLILLLDEMANIPPVESTVGTWEDALDEIADQLTEICQRVDPESTDETLQWGRGGDELVGTGRR